MFDKIDDFVSDLKSEFANLERENYKLKRKIEELQKEKENKNWKPEERKIYYYVNSLGKIFGEHYVKAPADLWRHLNGNFFKNKYEAEKYIKNIKTKGELRELANELNGERKVDWDDGEQKKYYIYYNYSTHQLISVYDNVRRDQGTIYCSDKNFLNKAIERIGEEKLINIIKEGV
jgi:hypothetical protein